MDNISIVLVGITHPGNIGAVARVMKNMALRKLTLVSSTDCGPDTEAFPMASGAYDIVERARKTTELQTALSETVMAIGASSRLGGKRVSAKTPAELVPQLMETAMGGPVACVFGRESRGLTNDEFKLCTHHMIIPTDAGFASMNLAHSVAVTGYEIFKAAGMPAGFQARKFRPASSRTREDMYEHIEQVLLRSGFLDSSNPLRMMRDVRRIFNSALMDDRDVKIIRGIFRNISNMVKMTDEKMRSCGRAEPTGPDQSLTQKSDDKSPASAD